MKSFITFKESALSTAVVLLFLGTFGSAFVSISVPKTEQNCFSRLRQIGLAVSQYQQDADGRYPMSQYYVDGDPNQWVVWNDVVSPYLHRHNALPGAFTCPSNPAPEQLGGSYAVHLDVSRVGELPGSGDLPIPTFAESGIANPGEKIYVLERGVNRGSTNFPMFTPWEWDWTPGLYAGGASSVSLQQGDCDSAYDPSFVDFNAWGSCGMLPRYRHATRANVSMLDGHATSFRRTASTTEIDWLKNVYVAEASQYDSSWYPY